MKLYTDEGAKGEQNKASEVPRAAPIYHLITSPGEHRLHFLYQHIKTFQGRYGVNIQSVHSWRRVLLEALFFS